MTTPAALRPDATTRGVAVMRCTGCGKVAYATQELATAAAEKIAQQMTMYVYLDDKCGWWHLSRSAPRTTSGPR